MKKLKYVKLFEQFRMNEEIFNLFGKKQPKEVQSKPEVNKTPEQQKGEELMKTLFPNNTTQTWITPEKLYSCFVGSGGESPDQTFEKFNEVFELTTIDHFIEMRYAMFGFYINHNLIPQNIKDIFGNNTLFKNIANLLDLIYLSDYEGKLKSLETNIKSVSEEAATLLENLKKFKGGDTSLFDNFLNMYQSITQIVLGKNPHKFDEIEDMKKVRTL